MTSNASDDRFVELWTDYLEGELDEAGTAALRALLGNDDGRLKLAADTYQTHRLLGFLAGEGRPVSVDFVEATLARLPADEDRFTFGVMRQLGQSAGLEPGSNGVPHPPTVSRRFRRWPVAAAVVVLSALLALSLARGPSPHPSGRGGPAPVADAVRLASSAGARFFGELSPPVGSTLAARRDYVLMSGLVRLAFPRGASAIVEGPAVFRVVSDEALALDAGRCSVYAPPGAEGFRVETPVTRVVDRGTRFTVSVAETSETEVQVIEGAADVSGRPENIASPQRNAARTPGRPSWELHLASQDARRFWGSAAEETAPVRFTPSIYRSSLPDRVVSYEAVSNTEGAAERLTHVSVQRGGAIVRYPAGRLIPVDLTWFRSAGVANPHGHLAAGAVLPKLRGDVLSDLALNTGVINPGGAVRPLERDPILNDRNGPGTPGLAVRFRSPVVNREGPDVLLFELQTALNPPDGDAFHVSPLKFREGLRSHTVHAYDLTMTSPESLKLAPFFLYRYQDPVTSLSELQTGSCVRMPRKSNFHALAVGIDLSDLGFPDGEHVDGLFFQDAQDDVHQVDPVLIAGLPETVETGTLLKGGPSRSSDRPRTVSKPTETVPGGH